MRIERGLPQIMEELGFPVVKMLLDRFDTLNTFVQPVLKPESALEDLLDINAPPQDIDWRNFKRNSTVRVCNLIMSIRSWRSDGGTTG